MSTAACAGASATSVLAMIGASHASSAPASPPIVWTDVDGHGYGPVQLRARAATVFVFVSSQCTLSNQYASRLRRLQDDYFAHRVSLFLVDSLATDSVETERSWAATRGLNLALVKDAGTSLADRLGAVCTAEAVVVDRDGNIVYRGGIDDRADESLVRRRYVREVLDALVAGRPAPAEHPTERLAGCIISHPDVLARPAGNGAACTYAGDVAPILNRACVSCHREGEVAPFSLGSYAQAKLWSAMIADVTGRGVMPPWQAAAGYGTFRDARTITPQEVALLQQWSDAGAPAGDLRLAPAPPPPPGAWSAGKPELIVTAERPFRVTAEGKDEYRCVVLPLTFTRDTYVTLTQIHPSAPSVVHHVIVYIDPSGIRGLDASAADPHRDGDGFDNPNAGVGDPVDGVSWLAAWAPGNQATPTAPGVAVRIPKGARLIMEVHYHRSGKEETDHTAVGLTFSRDTVDKQLLTVDISPRDGLYLPAGDAAHHVTAQLTAPTGVTVRGVFPHMHQLGKSMHVWAEAPSPGATPAGAKPQELIWVKNWDFNWQTTYDFAQPIELPRGTVVKVDAVYDNSENNLRNPHRPPQPVHWGESTSDEMCIAFLQVTVDNEHLNATPGDWRESVAYSPTLPLVARTSAVLQRGPTGPDLLPATPAGWALSADGSNGAKAHVEPIDGGQRVVVDSPGTAHPWDVDVSAPPLILETGRMYDLHFRARTDHPRHIGIRFQQQSAPYNALGLYEQAQATGQWQTFDFRFRAGAASPPGATGPCAGSLTFHLNGIGDEAVAGAIDIADSSLRAYDDDRAPSTTAPPAATPQLPVQAAQAR
jgi:hypothetical protein